MKPLIPSFDSLQNKVILVIGDIMLDEFLWCSVSRISPEAPVPVCKVTDTTLVPGGAANVAHNIQALGSRAILMGLIGKDSSGEKLKNQLAMSGIESTYILEDPKRPTILKSRIIAHHQHVVRVDREETKPITSKQITYFLNQVETLIPTIDIILISDYLKGTLPDAFLKELIKLAHQNDKRVIVDPKGDIYKKYTGADLLTPNMSEFQQCISKKVTQEDAIQKEATQLIKKLKLKSLLVTRSEKGMSIISENGDKFDIPTQAKEVFDITGAGDTAIAALSIGLASGLSLYQAAYLSNFAAGIVVGKIGTATTSLQELERAWNND